MHVAHTRPADEAMRQFGVRPRVQMPSQLQVRRATAFSVAAALVGYLALDSGGYDIAIRQRIGFLAWAAIAVGFAIGVLPRSNSRRIVAVPLAFAAALLVWMTLSLHWTGSAERTMAEIARLLTYLALITAAVVSLNRHTFRSAAAGLSTAALAVVGLAVASRLDPSAFPGAAKLLHAFHTDRLSYPLDYWNAIGAWGAMSIAIGLAWSAHARLAAIRAATLATVPVAGLAVYLSYSRGGVIGACVAVIAAIALSRNRWTCFAHAVAAGGATAMAILVARGHPQIAHATGGSGGRSVLGALLVGAAICAVAVFATRALDADRLRLPRPTANWAVPAFVSAILVLVLVAGHSPMSRAWNEFKNQDAPTSGPNPTARLTTAGGNRNNLWNSAIDAFDAHPLNGTGPGTWEFWHERNGHDGEFVHNAHSLYLEQMAELGLPGLLLLVGVLGGLTVAALQARRVIDQPGDIGASVAMCSSFAVFLVSAGLDWMWQVTAMAALALGGMGVAISAGSERLRRSRRQGVIGRPGLRGAIVGVALLAAIAEVPGLVSTARLRASETATRAGDLASAHSLAEQAISAEPWAATPHQQLASVELLQGQLGSAKDEIHQARQADPDNWRFPLVQVQIDVRAGDRRAAQRAFLQGRRLAPRLGFYSLKSKYALSAFSRLQLIRIYVREHPSRQSAHGRAN
jgi:O-antigen ligase